MPASGRRPKPQALNTKPRVPQEGMSRQTGRKLALPSLWRIRPSILLRTPTLTVQWQQIQLWCVHHSDKYQSWAAAWSGPALEANFERIEAHNKMGTLDPESSCEWQGFPARPQWRPNSSQYAQKELACVTHQRSVCHAGQPGWLGRSLGGAHDCYATSGSAK